MNFVPLNQVANAQIEALRLENRHLRQTILQQAKNDSDHDKIQEHLKAVQNAYTTTITKLEVNCVGERIRVENSKVHGEGEVQFKKKRLLEFLFSQFSLVTFHITSFSIFIFNAFFSVDPFNDRFFFIHGS